MNRFFFLGTTAWIIVTGLAIAWFYTHPTPHEELGGAVDRPTAISYLTTQEKKLLQDIYQEQGEKQYFVQAIKGNVANSEETLTAALPAYMSIDVIDGPRGKGYRLEVEHDDAIISIGYGAYADENTWVIPIAPVVASTTP